MLKGMRREIGVPPKRVRYGVRTQDLAQAMAAAETKAVWQSVLHALAAMTERDPR